MKEFENIISLTKNLNVAQRINLKKQLAAVQELKNPEMDKFLTQMDAIVSNTHKHIKQIRIKTDEKIAEVLAEIEEVKKDEK